MRLVEIPDDGIVWEYIWNGDGVVGERRVDLSHLPTIEAEPVRHGRWVVERHRSRGKFSHCSECGLVKMTADAPYLKFCPNCGCKMDGGMNNG